MKILPDNIAAAGLPALAPARGKAHEGALRMAAAPRTAAMVAFKGSPGVVSHALLACSLAAGLAGCSAAPVGMECRELQMRIDYADLSNDQLRFALQELEDCKRRLKDAQAKDSAFVEGAERRFTPEDSPAVEPGE